MQIGRTTAALNKLDESGDSAVSHTSRTPPAGATEMETVLFGALGVESWEARDIQLETLDAVRECMLKWSSLVEAHWF